MGYVLTLSLKKCTNFSKGILMTSKYNSQSHSILLYFIVRLFSVFLQEHNKPNLSICVVVVQSLSHVRLFPTQWTAACQASLAFTISQSLLKLMSIESMMLSNHLILCCCVLLLPSIFPSIRVLFQ